MIVGVHAMMFTRDVDADRAFVRDVLGFKGVDVCVWGGGWLLFALPPAELAFHEADAPKHEIYLMCDDIKATLQELEAKGVKVLDAPVGHGWGISTAIAMPSGAKLEHYEPKHPTAIKLRPARKPPATTRRRRPAKQV